ncbi:MAG: hypothetical protein ACUVRU_07285, partial [Anaerolineae bacterium]
MTSGEPFVHLSSVFFAELAVVYHLLRYTRATIPTPAATRVRSEPLKLKSLIEPGDPERIATG